VITYIDNVIIVGNNEHEIKLVATRFLARAAEINAILNDTTIKIQSSIDILGEHYDSGGGQAHTHPEDAGQGHRGQLVCDKNIGSKKHKRRPH